MIIYNVLNNRLLAYGYSKTLHLMNSNSFLCQKSTDPNEKISDELNKYQKDLIKKEIRAMNYMIEGEFLFGSYENEENHDNEPKRPLSEKEEHELEVLGANALFEYLSERVKAYNNRRKGFK